MDAFQDLYDYGVLLWRAVPIVWNERAITFWLHPDFDVV